MSLALCAVIYVPIAAIQWPATMPSRDVIGSIIILAAVCTAAGFLVFAALIEEIGPVRATVITYISPAVAAVLGVFVLQESLTPPMLVGFVLVIVGSVLATRSRGESRDSPPHVAGAGCGVRARAEGDMVVRRGARVECPDCGAIAQLGERLNGIQKVKGSNPFSSTSPRPPYRVAGAR